MSVADGLGRHLGAGVRPRGRAKVPPAPGPNTAYSRSRSICRGRARRPDPHWVAWRWVSCHLTCCVAAVRYHGALSCSLILCFYDALRPGGAPPISRLAGLEFAKLRPRRPLLVGAGQKVESALAARFAAAACSPWACSPISSIRRSPHSISRCCRNSSMPGPRRRAGPDAAARIDQIAISLTVNALIVMAAGSVAVFSLPAVLDGGATMADGNRAGGALRYGMAFDTGRR